MAKDFQEIQIDKLIVNPSNDRHGELPDEPTAIAKLLDDLPDRMRKLAKDIADTGEVYAVPVVYPTGDGKFVVFDGNRRVTCLKLLHKPELTPDDTWSKYFKKTAAERKADLPKVVDCHVTTDQDWIDNFLYRTHTGAQHGVGQIDWDNKAKTNFVVRTGKDTKLKLGAEIEEKLRAEKLIDEGTKVHRSNLERLLSSAEFHHRVGLSIKDGKVYFQRTPDKVLAALARIIEDLAASILDISRLTKNPNKRTYLDKLDKEGILPIANDDLEVPVDFKTGEAMPGAAGGGSDKPDNDPKPHTPPPPPPPPKPSQRKHLIRPEDGSGLTTQSHTKRAMDIWGELQHCLEFGKHDNAIAVLFRVLVEFAVENYISQKSVAGVYDNDKLAKKFVKALDHMLATSAIDKKYHEGLKKFENTEPMLSANTMNKYVHHKSFFPSDHHLKSMWDTIEDFVVICLKA